MTRAILCLNAGSSSLKFGLFPAGAGDAPLLSGAVERIGGDARLRLCPASGPETSRPVGIPDHRAALDAVTAEISAAGVTVAGVGHRVVHGGATHAAPALIDDATLDGLRALEPLAPLHEPQGIAGVDAARARFPDAHHVACFDTAFHADKARIHDIYGLPREMYDRGIRRYGFHGLSCASIVRQLSAEGALPGRLVIAHLGNGCSVTAVQDGRGAASSMGFSALDGLVMGTRVGHLDPGVLLHLMRQGYTADALEDLLYRRSGLLGLSGLSNDMRDLLGSDAEAAAEAVEIFVARAAEEIARLAAVLGGLDAVVFTGGIGERSEAIRTRIARRLGFLPGFAVLTRPCREEHEILRATRALLAS